MTILCHVVLSGKLLSVPCAREFPGLAFLEVWLFRPILDSKPWNASEVLCIQRGHGKTVSLRGGGDEQVYDGARFSFRSQSCGSLAEHACYRLVERQGSVSIFEQFFVPSPVFI